MAKLQEAKKDLLGMFLSCLYNDAARSEVSTVNLITLRM